MSWDCCTPDGRCQRGHGCPAGVVLHQDTNHTPNACPGHSDHPSQGVGVARVGKQHPLRFVQLDAAKPKPLNPVRLIGRRFLQLLGVAAVFVIWALATATADTRWQCTTNWESGA